MRAAPRIRRIASYAAPSDYAPLTALLLASLGYRLIPAEELEAGEVPDLHVALETRLAEVPASNPDRPVRMILLTGGRRIATRDPRVVGAVRRPAGPHELYQLFQAALEAHPRSAPRAPTRLAAGVRWNGAEGSGTILSLSENGCLIELPEPPPLESMVDIGFELPGRTRVETRAVATYQAGERLGLVFHGMRIAVRKAISAYVSERLAAAA